MHTPGETTTVPPLESGDHLTRSEFERRCEAVPPNVKAELIEGIVYMLTSVRFQSHAAPHGLVVTWLGTYAASTPGVVMADNPTVRLDADNEPQPDVLLFIDPEAGGQARVSEDDYLEGAPELIVEVAASSAAYDLHEKKNAYRRNGVREYVVWQVYENKLAWFVLEDERYLTLEPDEKGLIRSRTFPGLHLAVEALRERNLARVLDAVQEGTQTDEHAAFVERLSEA